VVCSGFFSWDSWILEGMVQRSVNHIQFLWRPVKEVKVTWIWYVRNITSWLALLYQGWNRRRKPMLNRNW
jgi:hypothetical protein